MPTAKTKVPPIVVVFGEEEYQKQAVVQRTLDALLPPEIDRAMVLSEYDGTLPDEQGGPTFAAIADDLATLPFLADRRVVVVRSADRFITAAREKLERWLAAPPPTAALIMECRSFPRNTKLYKAAQVAGGQIHECKKLYASELAGFVATEARAAQKRIDRSTADKLVALVGQEQGMLAGEVEKLCLYVGERSEITSRDVDELVGQSREEKVFAAMDAAAEGHLADALRLWHQVLTTDKDAVYRAVGGMAYKLRSWLNAQRLNHAGMTPKDIAPKVGMYGKVDALRTILRRMSFQRLTRMLGVLADLDAQAKTGARSIETGVEGVLIDLAEDAG